MIRSEKSILAQTLVDVSALPETLFYRNNTGMAWQGKRVRDVYPGTNIPIPPNVTVLVDARPVRFGLEGSGDIMGTFKGSAVAIETKTESGPQRTAQERFEIAWKKAGGVYLLVRSPEQAVNSLLLL